VTGWRICYGQDIAGTPAGEALFSLTCPCGLHISRFAWRPKNGTLIPLAADGDPGS